MKAYRSRAVLGALGLVGILVLALPALARSGHRGSCGHGGPWEGPCRLERRVERLDLEPGVREPVYAILDEARAGHRELRAKMHQAHGAMRELMASEAPDPEAVMAQADRLGALHTEMHKHKLRTLLEVREQIGSEAWAQLHAHRHHRGKGRGGPCDTDGDDGDR